MGLPGTIDRPRPEQFGVTAVEVDQAPELFVTRHRLLIFFALYVAAFGVAFALIFKFSDSIPAALTFGLVLIAAVSIVLVPLLICFLCASEKLETRWLCRRFPALEGCIAYREAMVEFRRLTIRSPDRPRDRDWWLNLSPPTFRSQVQQALECRDLALSPVVDRKAEGYDYLMLDERAKVLVRCESGTAPVEIGVGRELTACLAETGAVRAILVTEAGPTHGLAGYLLDHSIGVVKASEILGNPPAEL